MRVRSLAKPITEFCYLFRVLIFVITIILFFRRATFIEKYSPGNLHNFSPPPLKCKLSYIMRSPWMLLKQGTRNGNRGTCMGKQKGEGETTQRMGNEVTDRAKVGSHFSFSHFRVRSLFCIPRFSSILAYGHRRISGRRFSPPGWRDRKYVCVRSSG